ncbi:MAG: KamA family radical SAM protein [Candidatus Eremiobacterota bacterium]
MKNVKEEKKTELSENSVKRKVVRTKTIDDVFTDEIEMVKPKFEVNYDAYMKRLWEANPEIYTILKDSENLEKARDKVYTYLEKSERKIFETDNDLHILEKATVRECIRVFKSIIGPVNEYRTGVSALDCLWKLSTGKGEDLQISAGFLMEFINLFRGVAGKSNIYFESSEAKKGIPDFLQMEGRRAAEARTEILDELGSTMEKYFKKYPSGLDRDVINWRQENKNRIIRYFGGHHEDWNDYRWHLKNVIKTYKPLLDLIELTAEHKEAIKKASENRIPFGITPYYLSLMDRQLSIGYDHAIRAQVIPPPDYIDMMVENRAKRGCIFDFMGEHDTSPEELITRRYPGIAILKPFNTCAQICVYCQRNWEIDEVLAPDAMAQKETLEKSLKWFDSHRTVGDVLITGGDPCIMNDKDLKIILEILAKKEHIRRIRLGTRTPVVLPMRWTDDLINIISSFHEPGRREIAIVTHFEHSYEITPEAMKAVQKIRKTGISVYNQEVFTIENSRRFETAKLRTDLKLTGIDPYYTFNMKGKEETRKYMVPIARILQERKEEARLLPGLDRTDEPVFNVPKLGKNHLRAWQDHRVVMILPDGSRVYEFHPWEKNIKPVPPYNYVDVPIYDYLEELAARGENIREYRTIWFYY